MMKKIVVLSSGGDSPGMNAAIRAVVRTANFHDIEIFGSIGGYSGLMENNLLRLDNSFVANCIQRGGTILKTGRSEKFKEKNRQQAVRNYLIQQHIDGLIVLGGDGSFRGAMALAEKNGPKIIGIPCTIDNDITGTDYCIGFDTATNTAVSAIDKIRDTALSLERNFIIEVMGRASGFLAVDVGIAGGAEIILTPEFPLEVPLLAALIQKHRRKKMTSIIVAAEANQPGHTIHLAQQIKQLSGLEYRVCILGHIQRGGTPSTYDRKIASIMGAKAVEALLSGQTSQIIAVKQGEISYAPMLTGKEATRFFTDKNLLTMNDIICG